MGYEPSLTEIQALACDFEEDFGVTLPLDDARRMLVLYDELCLLFEHYSDEIPLAPHMLER
jgi:hypothetical protein